ncbi:MAG: hypothetical protein AB7O96_05390 [Pseudobdellovibrionaceae bacterium]
MKAIFLLAIMTLSSFSAFANRTQQERYAQFCETEKAGITAQLETIKHQGFSPEVEKILTEMNLDALRTIQYICGQ